MSKFHLRKGWLVINNIAGEDTALSFVGSRWIQLNWNREDQSLSVTQCKSHSSFRAGLGMHGGLVICYF